MFSWYDELARILTRVEDFGIWPDGLLDVYIALIPKTDGDAAPSGQRPLSVLPIAYRIWASVRMLQLEDWFGHGFRILSSVVAVLLRLGILLHLILKRCFLGLLTLMFIFLLLMLLSPLIRWIGSSWIRC